MSLVAAPKSFWMVGIATLTMLVSSTDMNMPKIRTISGIIQDAVPVAGGVRVGVVMGATSSWGALTVLDGDRERAVRARRRRGAGSFLPGGTGGMGDRHRAGCVGVPECARRLSDASVAWSGPGRTMRSAGAREVRWRTGTVG